MAMMLAACGGGGSEPPPAQYASLISFGDSLSDVGSYAVGEVQRRGAGKFTVNSPTSRIWLERLSAQLGLPAPCAARVGLDGSIDEDFHAMPAVEVSSCTAYGQGGSRVTEPIGVGHKSLGGGNARVGYLTEPVSSQIDRHLQRHGGRFSQRDLVLVQAGGNDLFIALGELALPPEAVQAMAVAGRALADQVRSKIVARGARHVVVVNLPDVSATPFSLQRERDIAGSRDFIRAMTVAFNAELALGLAGEAAVLLVDAYRASVDQAESPAQFGLSDVITPVCAPDPSSPVALGRSLLCNDQTLTAEASPTHLYADLIHPTPYGHRLLAQLVALALAKQKWL